MDKLLTLKDYPQHLVANLLMLRDIIHSRWDLFLMLKVVTLPQVDNIPTLKDNIHLHRELVLMLKDNPSPRGVNHLMLKELDQYQVDQVHMLRDIIHSRRELVPMLKDYPRRLVRTTNMSPVSLTSQVQTAIISSSSVMEHQRSLGLIFLWLTPEV